MSDELNECYVLLGVAPTASAQELKAAYRDLAKVWHPDRFSHDPRLQQKAQEKLAREQASRDGELEKLITQYKRLTGEQQ